MARPKQFDDEALLESMRETFLSLGPGVSTQELARRARVSEGTLFKRFGSKRKMFTEALRLPEIEECDWYVDIEKGVRGCSIEDYLTKLGLELHAMMSQVLPCVQIISSNGKLNHQDLVRLLGEDADEKMPAFIVIHRLQMLFEDLMAEGRIRRVDSESLARLFLGPVLHDVQMRMTFPEGMPRTEAEVISRLVRTLVELIDPAGMSDAFDPDVTNVRKARAAR